MEAWSQFISSPFHQNLGKPNETCRLLPACFVTDPLKTLDVRHESTESATIHLHRAGGYKQDNGPLPRSVKPPVARLTRRF